ncbi:MAG TPA: xanthine dehydrogenase family protein molybdopterin-binding subunit [Candidatus Binataceae bacterium]|nr:xanthine dehydrogenase family protein molybdopterin-binding subunit [Candidatus Binataceae bacterium]
MAVANNLSRREFFRAGAAASGGLLVAFYLPLATEAGEGTASFAPNAFIRLRRDGSITLIVGRSEMGQGVLTSLPMLLADEMDADWKRVRVEQAPALPAYANPLMHINLTGGSNSVRGSWIELRQAGAVARTMLIAAAAERWKVNTSDCRAHNGYILGPREQRLSYGALAARAAAQPVPTNVTLKRPEAFTLIGRPIPRVDTPLKVNGRAVFGIDVKLPGMLQAVVARSPVFGGKVKSFDPAPAKAVAGVREVIQISTGVAVVAEHFWAAKQGRDALRVEWEQGPLGDLDSGEITRMLSAAADKPAVVAQKIGDAQRAQASAAKTVEAVYQLPYLAHATMEPMNCTADVRPDRCDVYAPTQGQTPALHEAMRITGLPADKVNVTTTFLGGGFGRRGMVDYVVEAVEVSKALGRPAKVIWTREDDMRHDGYRPVNYSRLQGGLDRNGNIVAWQHRIAAPSLMLDLQGHRPPRDLDKYAVEGAVDLPYAIPNQQIEYALVAPGIPVHFWRSVGHSYTAFVVESFVDELAAAAGKDPYEFRLKMVEQARRYRNVLMLVADKAGWGKPLPAGVARGIALHNAFGSYVAEVAEVSIEGKGEVRVRRVVAAVDCGTIVNPNTIEAQVQSAIVYGLSAALMGEITIRHGGVVQHNFDDYPVLRLPQMPKVEVYPVAGGPPMGGIGEVAVPPIAPAVANAIFALSGKRVRNLPIRAKDLA